MKIKLNCDLSMGSKKFKKGEVIEVDEDKGKSLISAFVGVDIKALESPAKDKMVTRSKTKTKKRKKK